MENNIVMANVELSLDNTEKKRFSDLPGNQFPVNFKRFMGLEITLVKFIYPKAGLSVSLCCFVLS